MVFHYKKNFQKKNNLLNTYVRFEEYNSKIKSYLGKLNVPLFKNIFKKKIYNVRLFCEMIPNISNSISLKKNKTLIKLKFSQIDYKTINLLAENVKYFSSKDPEKESSLISKIQLINLRMHHIIWVGFVSIQIKKLSVVDKNLRILGLNNICLQ